MVFKDKITDLNAVLEDVAAFYEKKGLKAILYQATAEEGYFASNTDVFAKHGFKNWEEDLHIMATAINKTNK